MYDSALAAHLDVGPACGARIVDGSRYPEGTTWRAGDAVYRVRRLRRREALAGDPAWEAVFDRMRGPAQTYGARGVRLAAWFEG